MKCAACDQDRYYNSPERTAEEMEAAQPPALSHVCKEKGPKTKKALLEAIHAAAVSLHFGFSAAMGGGNYHAKEELDGLLRRLAEYKVPGKSFMGFPKDHQHRYWNSDLSARA